MTGNRHQEHGFVLWALVFSMALVLGYSFYRLASSIANKNQREAMLASTLLRAKEALLARAVNDQNRPGSLPCPDLMTNSSAMNNFSGDGKADMLAGNYCPSHVGWLPWITLDLPEANDDMGNHLWYALSPTLRDDDSAQPINSDTPAALEVDGKTDIAAIIIAPRTALTAQQRPSNHFVDYLEGNNGLNSQYHSGPQNADFNDMLISITRSELMAAVGKRVAGELRNCLEQHANASTNTAHRYPWPAPLSEAGHQGKTGTRFGRVASSQPGSGPEAALKASIEQLAKAQEKLAGSLDAPPQLQALMNLSDAALQARNLFGGIFTVSSKLKQAADEVTAHLQSLAGIISEANENGQISLSEGDAIRTLDKKSSTSLEQLPRLLGEFGIDVFPWELTQRTDRLALAKTPEELLDRARSMQDLLTITHTSRSDLALSLAAAQQAATYAEQASRAAIANTGDGALLEAAKLAAKALLDSAKALGASSAASRVNILAKELDDFPALLEELKASLNESGELANLDALINGLTATRQAITNINTGVSAINRAREESLSALDAAITAAQTSRPKRSDLESNTAWAIERCRALVATIASNEASDNNLGRSSVLEALQRYRAAQMQFAAIDTTIPRPLQRDIQPYTDLLGNAAGELNTWAQIITYNSASNAPLAKAEAALSDKALTTTTAQNDSAYAAATAVLEQINGTRGSAETIQAYIDKPSPANKTKANTALAESLALTQKLIQRAQLLAATSKGSTASAFPMVWNARRCDFLQANQKTWWNDNHWSETLFYQISSPLAAAPSSLTVNNTGKYRLVVLASGPLLTGQRRNIATVANFLEGINAAPSRDGDANFPSKHFSGAALSPSFNDRLAY